MNLKNDAATGALVELEQAKILNELGDYEKTIAKLALLIPFGGSITVAQHNQEPIWESLWEMEGFKALINNPVYQINL